MILIFIPLLDGIPLRKQNSSRWDAAFCYDMYVILNCENEFPSSLAVRTAQATPIFESLQDELFPIVA